MIFSKGRSTHEAFIEDTVLTFEQLISDISMHLRESENLIETKISQTVKSIADGDKEVEANIRSSMYSSFIDFKNIYDCFYESQIISIYALYERILKIIVCENKLDLKKRTANKSYAITYIEIIKKSLNISTFDNKIEAMILFIDSEFRELRNNLVHEGQSDSIYNILRRINSKFLIDNPKYNESAYILYSLDQINTILLDIALVSIKN